jgi:hypothetical protein
MSCHDYSWAMILIVHSGQLNELQKVRFDMHMVYFSGFS